MTPCPAARPRLSPQSPSRYALRPSRRQPRCPLPGRSGNINTNNNRREVGPLQASAVGPLQTAAAKPRPVRMFSGRVYCDAAFATARRIRSSAGAFGGGSASETSGRHDPGRRLLPSDPKQNAGSSRAQCRYRSQAAVSRRQPGRLGYSAPRASSSPSSAGSCSSSGRLASLLRDPSSQRECEQN